MNPNPGDTNYLHTTKKTIAFAKRGMTITALTSALALGLAVSGDAPAFASGSSIVSALSRKYAGESITVLLPPWGDMPKSELAKFTAKTGIKVTLTSIAWGSIHDKVVASEAAGVAPADITEVDWSWVGQFGRAGWYTNEDSLLPQSLFKSSPVAPIFKYNGKQIAMPYNIDFRSMIVNMTDLNKAGITSPPRTWTQLKNDAAKLKAKGIVKNPIGMQLGVGEDTSTGWYQLIKAAGGEVLNAKDEPAFSSPNSAGAKAMTFIATLYKDGLVTPGEITDTTGDPTAPNFEANLTAFVLDGSPGSLAQMKDPKVSKVAKDNIEIVPTPTPSASIPSTTFGLPEGLGILKQAKNKAACAMFILWWEQYPQLLYSYDSPNMGNLPPITSAIHKLSSTGKLVDGSEVEKILPGVKPLFANGAPVWYPEFSTDAATEINAVAEGHASVNSAISTLVSETKSLNSAS
jgi:multiple sugar transport system substrate-binding protein